MALPSSVENLKKIIAKLPTMSSRGAERFLEWWWNQNNGGREEFLKEWEGFTKLNPCKLCFYFAEGDLCQFCNDKKRDRSKICVIASPFTVPLIEKEVGYKGLYFVLGGEIVSSYKLKEIELVKKRVELLKDWIEKEKTKEVIIATDFTTAGSATAMYLKEELEKLGVQISRLAQGFHQGDALSYSDPLTLKRAFSKRDKL